MLEKAQKTVDDKFNEVESEYWNIVDTADKMKSAAVAEMEKFKKYSKNKLDKARDLKDKSAQKVEDYQKEALEKAKKA